MPLDEEGAKWSCEPCVRGHRSSKCQHFDRLMMKVPKAGRPLAKCPHPKGSCSCQKLYAFMVRIPKGSTCLCRPLYKVPMSAVDTGQSPAPAIAPASSPSAGKVQKYSRRQSNLQAAPENIAKALNSMPEFSNQQANNGMTPPVPPYMFQYPPGFGNQSGTFGPSGTSTANGPTTTPPEQIPDAGANVEAQKGSCCPSKSKPAPQPQPQEKGSCCGGKPRADVAESSSQLKQEGHEAPAMPFNFAPYPAFPGYWPPSWQGGPPPQNFTFDQSYPQNPYYTNGFHVPDFSPPPPMNFAPSNFQQNMNTINAAMPQFMPTNSNGYFYAPLPTFGADSGHECNCGDDCQCLGCATHPFNDTTRQHIQQMGYMMALREEDEHSEGSDGCRNTPLAGQMSPTTFNYPALAENNLPTDCENGQESVKGFSGQSSSQSFDNGFSASHHAGQQLMQPSQYYTVEYPVGLLNACCDVTGTCQCGNDCSCDGCLTHSGHNATSIHPSTNESIPSKTAEYTAPSSEPPVHSRAPIPTLEDPSFSPLSPPAIEPQAV